MGSGRVSLARKNLFQDRRPREVADRVMWLEDGAFGDLASMATDPVCGMAVQQDPAFHLQADAQEWWFCSDGCRVDFAVHPDRYPEGRSRLR